MEFRRRSAIKLWILGAGAAGAALAAVGAQAAPQTRDDRTAKAAVMEGPERPTRYLFSATLYDGTQLPDLTSLEELWANSRYLQVASCRVTYVGPRPQALTAEENAAVDAALAAGAQGSREDICLAIVAGATRLDQRTIEAGVRALGSAIVSGVLVLAPQAPQAAIMKRWSDAGFPA